MRELDKARNSAENSGNEVKQEPYFIERQKELNTRQKWHKNLAKGLSVLGHIFFKKILVSL